MALNFPTFSSRRFACFALLALAVFWRGANSLSAADVNWINYSDEFKKEIQENGGLMAEIKNISILMDQGNSTVKVVLTPAELEKLLKSGPLNQMVNLMLEGLVILQVQFSKEKNIPIAGRFFSAHLHLAEPGIAKDVRYRKLGFAYYNEHTDAVEIKK